MVLPRFLAPGDHAAAALNLNNVEGEPGTYVATMTAQARWACRAARGRR